MEISSMNLCKSKPELFALPNQLMPVDVAVTSYVASVAGSIPVNSVT